MKVAPRQQQFLSLKEITSEKVRITVTIPRRVQVQARTGLSRSSIYKLMQEGIFPKELSLGPRAVGWRHDDIDQWLESRPVKS